MFLHVLVLDPGDIEIEQKKSTENSNVLLSKQTKTESQIAQIRKRPTNVPFKRTPKPCKCHNKFRRVFPFYQLSQINLQLRPHF